MEKITTMRNGNIAHAKKLGKSRDYRKSCGEFICDGRKLLTEAIKSGIDVVSVFTAAEPDMELPDGTDIFKVTCGMLESISALKNPQDILFICKIPGQKSIEFRKGIHILLDNVQDPGNVGTVIRSADAFGISSVILAGSCADPYNPKAIRASMGAVFRQKHAFMSFEALRGINARFIGTAAERGSIDVREANLKDAVIIMGSEGQGISNELYALCEDIITIPVAPHCESLNVAAAASVIMWEAKKELSSSKECNS